MVCRIAALVAFAPALALAAPTRCLDADFTPTGNLQIVVWLETADGQYVDTLYVTQQVGSFGLGNRPGRYDFNSAAMWPYGRRIDAFPVWSHRNGQSFPSVLFQNDTSEDPAYCTSLAEDDPLYLLCGENDLSHPADQSSPEVHYCQPLPSTSVDATTCPSPSYTDKGRLSSDSTYDTGYPPRTDLVEAQYDSPSVAMYKAMDPFDAVSQPTPIGGDPTHAPWAIPASLADGDYVLYIETALESDFNTTYNATSQPPPPGIAWSTYGVPTRGQPSIVYAVPISISDGTTVEETATYAGYGSPTGSDGALNPPDATITTDTPGAGASRLQLVADGSDMYRVRVSVAPDDPSHLPGVPTALAATSITSTDATVTFAAPGAGGEAVFGYDVRVLAGEPITEANFGSATPITAKITPVAPGGTQTVDIGGLLPLTEYWIGIRAYDGCDTDGPLAVLDVTTPDRESGEVSACFVATAAYGSILANDVEALRRFRDLWLKTNAVGELGVEAYYTFGPALAGVIGESDVLRQTARDALGPLVRAIKRR